MTSVLGIDESGRGPVIGPLVICGYMIDDSKMNELKKLGVRDSKLLKDEKRRGLEKELKAIAKDFILISIPANELDRLMEIHNLNRIEILKMQEIINLLLPDKVIIDSPETNTSKFCEKVKSGLKNKKTVLICENFADKKYPVVSAASIMAKVTRDNAVEKIKKEAGFDFGTGYSHDERTVKFLKEIYSKHKKMPGWVRKKWATTKNIIKSHKKEGGQKKMTQFFN